MLAPAVLPLGRFAGMTARAVNDRPYGVVICLLPYSLKIWYFRQVCRGRIDASRAVLPIYRNIRAAATGGIYAAPTNNRKSSNYRQNVIFPQVCKGRIDASRAVLPLYRNIRAVATGGIVAVPTNDPQNCHHRKTRGGHSFFLISYFLFLISYFLFII